MKRVTVLGATLLAAGLALAPESAAAQAEVGAQLDLFSAYVWRGLSLTNKPVAQPSAYVSFPAGNASVTLGGWATVDIGDYDDPEDDISEGGGGSFNLTEFDPYAEVAFSAGKATITGGVTGYFYPNDLTDESNGGLDSDANTWEIYGKVGFEEVPLAPEIAIYYDIDAIKGAYIQGSVGHTVPLNEKLGLELGGAVGFSAGQGVSENADESANFFDDGLTHVDFSAGLPLTAGVLSITPVVHFQISSDEFTKFNSPSNPDEDFKIWGGVSIGWSKTLGEVPEEEEAEAE